LNKQSKFLIFFEPISAFGARKGYKRCLPPGFGYSVADGQSAIADLWRHLSGDVVARLTSRGYDYSFKLVKRSREPLLDKEIYALERPLMTLLETLIVEGADDWPSIVETGYRSGPAI
jgi:hypothetical protein